ASRGGKLKTLLQVLAISLYMLPGVPEWLREAVMAAAVVVTLGTGGDYVGRAIPLRPRPGRGAGSPAPGRAPRLAARPAGHDGLVHPPGGLAAEIVSVLGGRGQTLATAESLTGGLLGAAVTAVPGASIVYRGGVIAYATELKAVLLGVPEDLLAR